MGFGAQPWFKSLLSDAPRPRYKKPERFSKSLILEPFGKMTHWIFGKVPPPPESDIFYMILSSIFDISGFCPITFGKSIKQKFTTSSPPCPLLTGVNNSLILRLNAICLTSRT